MPIESLWPLLIAIIAIAFACVLETAKTKALLKHTNNQLGSLLSELDILKKDNQKTVTTLAEMHKIKVENMESKHLKEMLTVAEHAVNETIDKIEDGIARFEHKNKPSLANLMVRNKYDL